MCPNGLCIIHDIDPALLQSIRDVGYPFIYRRWMRHDGVEVACAQEDGLFEKGMDGKEKEELQSIGIRRWKLQKALYDAAVAAGIPVHFGKRIEKVTVREEDGLVECKFADDSAPCLAKVVFGADGVKSKIRESIVGTSKDPEYTGVSCLMGVAEMPRPVRGICFPSSSTTKCHMCTYPTGDNETVFQIYFPTPRENPDSWGLLSEEEGRKECSELAVRLRSDGWDEALIAPLDKASTVLRVGLRARDPLEEWVSGPIALLGDAAHPPVPYIGQGAQMAIEDAGIAAHLMKDYCIGKDGEFDAKGFPKAMEIYQLMRINRTRQVLGLSKGLGKTQQDRADSWLYNIYREWQIRLQVLFYKTLPCMFPGARYNFLEDLKANSPETEVAAA
uniref:FAD-binding domain-containing protein n=1 Tax=Helicotheca tamesis TaxID=374047 RepID=A0A7S2MSZ9_9STRA|mmetsp:Transcript_2956/g.4002  ORF Transcript_2956/g.4002 Transcript_2956/m.4002 type:complete len:389 (+) Transcript_2956:307-1473(+)